MNHDFLIPATPGIARSLLRLSASKAVSVDPAILELTNDGLYGDDDFAALPDQPTATQRSALQILRDFDHHAVLLEPLGDRDRPAIATIMMACALASPGPVTVFTTSKAAWACAGDALTPPPDVRSFTADALSGLSERRGGLLVLDLAGVPLGDIHEQMSRGLVSEFRRTIIVGAVGRQWWLSSDVAELAAILSPGAPTHLLSVPKTSSGLQKNLALLRKLGVNSKRVTDLPITVSFLFNVCTDLIPTTQEFVINSVEPNENLHPQDP